MHVYQKCKERRILTEIKMNIEKYFHYFLKITALPRKWLVSFAICTFLSMLIIFRLTFNNDPPLMPRYDFHCITS